LPVTALRPRALLKKVLALKRSLRAKSYIEPWKSFSPPRVTTVTVPPPERPISAV
jgi:hypothetical protein